MKNIFFIPIAITFLLIGSCVKEEPEITYPNHCVADDFECRKGKWANISSSSASPDTLEFHSATKFSNYNAHYITGIRQGIIYQDYKFNGAGLVYYVNFINEPVNSPVYKRTTYNEVTGILSVHGSGSQKDEVYDYERVK
jgi:hypothetical protein